MTHWPNIERVGYLPMIFREDDPRPAREQAQERYAHGGGWIPFHGFALNVDNEPKKMNLHYPEDPPMRYISHTQLRNELIVLFEHSWVAIIQDDGSYEIARMD